MIFKLHRIPVRVLVLLDLLLLLHPFAAHVQGECVDDTCKCADGYHGDDCGVLHCKNECSGNGFCQLIVPDGHLGGICKCSEGFYGDDCSRRGCPRGEDSDVEVSAHTYMS